MYNFKLLLNMPSISLCTFKNENKLNTKQVR